MKTKCNVAKDLMPLVIDGVASEESQQYVDEHIAECHECKLICGEMHAALPQVTAEKENAALEKAAKAMRTKRTIRALWAVVMGMTALLIVLLINAGTVAEFLDDTWYQLRYIGPNDELRFDAYNVELAYQPYGSAVLKIESSPTDNRPFVPQFELKYDGKTGEAYLQLRAYAVPNATISDEYYGEENSLFEYQRYSDVFGYEYSHMDVNGYGLSYSYPGDEDWNWWKSVPITHIELVCGEDKLILWENGDGLPASWKGGQLNPGTEPIPTPTPTRTPGYWNPNTTSIVVYVTPTFVSTPTPTPRPDDMPLFMQ